jgi:hypothetical protein
MRWGALTDTQQVMCQLSLHCCWTLANLCRQWWAIPDERTGIFELAFTMLSLII